MLHLANSAGFSLFDAAALIGVIAAIATGFVAVRKLGPEKDSIYITSAQGAAVIQTNLIATLQAEVERERGHAASLQTQVDRLEAEVDRLEAANLALAKRRGTRHQDQSRTGPDG